MGASETLSTRLLSSQRSFSNVFLQNKYIFKKDLCFICNTNIFCIKIYFSNSIYNFLHFHLYFSLKKKIFSVKKFFNIKRFFHIKMFFLQIMYILYKTDILFPKKKISFFNLVLQQMNNHKR